MRSASSPSGTGNRIAEVAAAGRHGDEGSARDGGASMAGGDDPPSCPAATGHAPRASPAPPPQSPGSVPVPNAGSILDALLAQTRSARIIACTDAASALAGPTDLESLQLGESRVVNPANRSPQEQAPAARRTRRAKICILSSGESAGPELLCGCLPTIGVGTPRCSGCHGVSATLRIPANRPRASRPAHRMESDVDHRQEAQIVQS